jgi:hypothetical protein
MIKTVLLLHFVMGAVLPFIAERTNNALIKLKHKTDWLNNGYIQHHDYSVTKNNLFLWLGISMAYVCLYAFIIYVSVHILYSNY